MMEVVCGIIEDGEGRVLACQRPEGKHLGGKWEFPGGKIETGETAEMALIRELQEELGVEISVVGKLTPVKWDYPGKCIVLIPLRCRIDKGVPRPLEHAAIRWVDPLAMERLNWAEADRPILKEWLKLGGSISPD